MKILIINYAYFIIGGPERYMFNVKQLLEEHGHVVIPFSMDLKENVETKYSKYFASSINPDNTFFFNGKSSLKTKIKQIFRLFYSREVEKKLSLLIQKEKPDIAYILHYHKKLSPSVLVACKKNNLPIVVRLSDYLMLCPQGHFYKNGKICEKCKKTKFNSVRYKCVKNSLSASIIWFLADKYHHLMKFYDLIDYFVITNSFMKQKIIEYGFRNKISIIPTFAFKQTNQIISCKEKNIIQQICYIGKITEFKGADLLLYAFKQISVFYPKLKLVIMGRDEINFVRPFIKENPDLNIIYKNHSSKAMVLKTFSESLYSILPVKWYENLPNVILESFSVGTPVIGTNIGSIKSAIKDGNTGYLFNYNDPNDLTNVILKAINIKQDEYNNLQENCIDDIKNKYNSEVHYKKLLKLFGGLKNGMCSNNYIQM